MMPIVGVRYKCDNCFDFDFCETCHLLYGIGKKDLKTTLSTSHKQYHTYSRIQLQNNLSSTTGNGSDKSKLASLKT